MDILLQIGIVLIVGYIGGKIAKLIKLPNVSGYLVAGLFLGPSFSNFITASDSNSLSIISEVALGMIAFAIGNEFVIKDMLKLGKSILVITIAEVIGAVAVVFSVMYFGFNQPFAFSIVIAAMSAATAPAATLLVIKQYKAYGPLTKTILPVVALDDVLGIMVFGVSMSLAKLSISDTGVSTLHMFMDPFIEVGGSILLGIALGTLLVILVKRAKDHDETQILALAFIVIGVGLSSVLGLSPLLTNILMGATLVNLKKKSKRVFKAVNDFTPAIYVLFFTLAGASLDLGILMTVGLAGVAYVIARAVGKILGSYLGARVVKAEDSVRKYLGYALLPQGGISIGLSVIVRKELPEFAVAITTIIMFSILIYEVSGPVFAKIAISKAGEIDGLAKLEQKKEV